MNDYDNRFLSFMIGVLILGLIGLLYFYVNTPVIEGNKTSYEVVK